jgi:NADPH2 dehydrogenase
MNANRWTPYKFSNGKIAKNRIVIPPMASQSADVNGFVTSQTIEHYARLSQAGAGIIFVEYSYIHQSGKGEPFQLGAYCDLAIEGLQKISHIIHDAGAIAALQIVHAGGKADTKVTGQALLGPSSVSVPVKNWMPEIPVQMSLADIQVYIQWYVDAAMRAKKAGFDIVEIHAAHGYGLNQWLSPITNHRTDFYGGSIENRQRLLLEIIEAIKAETPELLISVRIPGQDHVEKGLSIQDMKSVVIRLEQIGVDLIDVSSGIGGWRRPENRNDEGYLVEDASQIKQVTSRPVIGVGGIVNGDVIDLMLLQDKLDFAAVGRAILQDPIGWFKAQLDGRVAEVAV